MDNFIQPTFVLFTIFHFLPNLKNFFCFFRYEYAIFEKIVLTQNLKFFYK